MILPIALPFLVLLFLVLVVVLIVMVELRILAYAYRKIGVRPRYGFAGLAVPMLVPRLAAVAVSLVLAFRRAPPVAYVSGSMGTLIGADVLNLGRIAELGAPMISIGGAGTFDGVFLTGIIAGLLA